MTRVFAGLVLVVAWGCSSVSESAPALTVRDSAGIAIVETRWDASLPVLRIDSLPEWEIGGDEGVGGTALHRVRDVKMAGRNRVVIADGGTQTVLLADLVSGTVQRSGGAGDGPSEFRGLSQLFVTAAGQIKAYDAIGRRLVVLDEDGRLVRASRPSVDFPPGETIVALAGGSSGDPRLYLGWTPVFRSEPGEGRFRGIGAAVAFYDPTDTLAIIRGREVFIGGGAAGTVLFGGTTVLAGGVNGVWVGDTAEQAVGLWQGRGRPVRIVRWVTDHPRRVTEATKAEFWRLFEAALPPEDREAGGQMRAILPFSDTIPAFSAIAVGPGGDLWIGSYFPPELIDMDHPAPAQEWIVLDLEAGRVSRAVLPVGFALRQIGEGFVLGVQRDPLGVETVRKYGFHRTENERYR
jgi:hypothetical protein